MKIPKASVPKTIKKKNKSKSLRRQLVLVPLVFFVIGIILSLGLYLSEKNRRNNANLNKPSDNHKNTTNVVEIEENAEFDEYSYLFEGVYKDVDLNTNVRFEDFIGIYVSLYEINDIKLPPVSIKNLSIEIDKINTEITDLFTNFDGENDKFISMFNNYDALTKSTSDFGIGMFSLFRIIYFLYIIIDKSINIDIVTHQEQIIYIEYLIVYTSMKKLITTFNIAINKKNEFDFFNNKIFYNKQIKEFGIKYKNVLSILTTDLYILKYTNIGLFKDNTGENKGTEIFQISDLLKFKLFVEFTFYIVLFNIFEFEKQESKINLKPQMKDFIYNGTLHNLDNSSEKEVFINEIEINCKDIFLFFDNSTKEYRDNWFKGYSKCIESIISLDEEIEVGITK